MAISLSNHEDRIKKLENTGSGKMQLLYITPDQAHNVNSIPLSDNITNYDFVVIQAMENSYSDSGINLSLQLTSSIFKVADIMSTKYVNYGAFASGNPISDDYNSGYVAKVTSSTLITVVARRACPFIHSVYGLKLYYNFSYNIYRLANSISFHFFKCLMNSFKGGVKEIWQLV